MVSLVPWIHLQNSPAHAAACFSVLFSFPLMQAYQGYFQISVSAFRCLRDILCVHWPSFFVTKLSTLLFFNIYIDFRFNKFLEVVICCLHCKRNDSFHFETIRIIFHMNVGQHGVWRASCGRLKVSMSVNEMLEKTYFLLAIMRSVFTRQWYGTLSILNWQENYDQDVKWQTTGSNNFIS